MTTTERLRVAYPDGLPSVVLEGYTHVSVAAWDLLANKPVHDEIARAG